MRSRFIINLVLLVFIIAVVVWLSLTEPEDTTEPPKLISDISPDRISTITIERKDKETVQFNRQDDSWRMQLPYQVPANPQRIQSILGLLKSESTDRLPVNNVDLSKLLLQEPAIVLKLDDQVFTFGDVNPLDKKRYVLHRDTVHLIHDNLYPQLDTSPVFFIDAQVVPDSDQLTMVQYPQFRLLKSGESWTLESELDINDESVQALAQTWKTLRAGNVQKILPMEPLYTISVSFENAERIDYQVTSDLPSLVLARPDLGLQYHIPEYLSEKLFPREDAPEAGAE